MTILSNPFFLFINNTSFLTLHIILVVSAIPLSMLLSVHIFVFLKLAQGGTAFWVVLCRESQTSHHIINSSTIIPTIPNLW